MAADNTVFVQHVGEKHVDHILATVEKKVSTDSLVAILPKGSRDRESLRVDLAKSFPDGECNCWGIVESMKKRLFDKMRVGDLLLLAPRFSKDLDEAGVEYIGVIRVLGPPSGSAKLSELLWGDSSYPYVMFFSTIKGFRSWRDFFRDVGYAETKRYRGEMTRVTPSRVPKGLNNYVRFLFSEAGGFHSSAGIATKSKGGHADKDGENAFNPSDLQDERERQHAAITIRRGQGPFRDGLLTAYQHRCAVTGCDVVDVLEAAHIIAYAGPSTDRVDNGMLLRGDIHTLFDSGLMAVDPTDYRVLVSKRLKGSCYESFAGQVISLPADARDYPSPKALEARLAEFKP